MLGSSAMLRAYLPPIAMGKQGQLAGGQGLQLH